MDPLRGSGTGADVSRPAVDADAESETVRLAPARRPPGRAKPVRQRPGRSRRGLRTGPPIAIAVVVIVAAVATVVHGMHKHHVIAAPDAGQAVAPATSSSAPPSLTITPTTLPPPSPTAPPPPVDDPAAVTRAVAGIDAMTTTSVQYGVAVLDRNTGRLTVGAEGSTQFYSASVLKLFVIVDILHRAEEGQVTITPDAQSEIQSALERSDDDAMDELWEDYDGPAAVQGMVSLANLQDTDLPDDLSQWGETLTSARDVVAVYQYALTSLSGADSALVLGDLAQATDTGADGFDQAFGFLAPTRAPTVKAKQGWMLYGSRMMLHTTAALGSRDQYVVAILTKQPSSIGWAAGRSNVNRAAAAMLAALGPAGVG